MENNFRRSIPNSYELSCRDKCNKNSLIVNLNCKEASFNRIFTPKDISIIRKNKFDERKQFIDFCRIYKNFEGVFYPQIRKDLVLTDEQVKSFDFIQDIPNTNIRIILQKGLKVDFEEFKERLIEFSNNNPRKRNIPLVRIDAKSNKDVLLLDQKLRFVRDNFKECAITYANWKAYEQNWDLVSSRLSGIDWYVFELPINDDGGFSLIAFCFSRGAKAVCHKRYSFGNNKPNIKFLNNNFSLVTIEKTDNGLKIYNGKNRKEYLKEDGRKTYVYPFSRWDRIVQANIICREELRNLDLSKVVSFQSAYRHFVK